jgi:hypothetical protein
MGVSRGKQFEQVIREAFEKVPNVSIDRLHDQTNGFRGSQNICDFIVYKEPYEYYIECKSVHGNTLPLRNITDTQWNGLLEKSKIEGVFAGIICWFIDKDITKFIPIRDLVIAKKCGYKSIRYDTECYIEHPMDELGYKAFSIEIKGKKKRVFFDYDMEEFLEEVST